jgi:membrane-bound inhibitor of C-type lysozyme
MKSKTTPHIAIAVIVVILVVAGGAFVLFTPKASGPSTTNSSTQTQLPISYSCAVGSIDATYITNTSATGATPSGLGSVKLSLSDGRTFTLPQVLSGSGIRYEQGVGTNQDVQFSSEGSNAFLMENGKTTYDNCVANAALHSSTATSTNTTGLKTFADQGNTFTFSYPASVTVSGGGVGYSTDWMVDATTSGMILAKATLPNTFEPKTNLGDSTFTIGTSADPSAISECLTYAPSGNGSDKSVITINGVTYTKFITGDAGAGNLYETTSYRTIRNNQCYAIEYTIHSTQIANYPPGAGITAFDHAKVQAVFESIVQSVHFK